MEYQHPSLEMQLRAFFTKAGELVQSNDSFVGDLFVYVKSEDCLVSLSDEAGQVLLQESIAELGTLKEVDNFDEAVAAAFRSALREEALVVLWEELSERSGAISFVLVDEDGETLEDITTFDKDMIILDDSFLEKIDRELDEFFERLMADVK